MMTPMTNRSIDPRQIEYLPLSGLEPDGRNPKAHDEGTINDSISRFGVLDLIVRDERTGRIISGHGRRKALLRMQETGEDAPEGVKVDEDGVWLVPVVTGWASRSDTEASAALIALNRTTELGGWDEDALLALLDDLEDIDGGLDGVGYSTEDIDDLRATMEDLADEDSIYTQEQAPIYYEPTRETPPDETELVDLSKMTELEADIHAADIPDGVRHFLLIAATRHAVFNYAEIAEYYAHATPEVQDLMEQSALVLLDMDSAIERGFTNLNERLDELRARDIADNASGATE